MPTETKSTIHTSHLFNLRSMIYVDRIAFYVVTHDRINVHIYYLAWYMIGDTKREAEIPRLRWLTSIMNRKNNRKQKNTPFCAIRPSFILLFAYIE